MQSSRSSWIVRRSFSFFSLCQKAQAPARTPQMQLLIEMPRAISLPKLLDSNPLRVTGIRIRMPSPKASQSPRSSRNSPRERAVRMFRLPFVVANSLQTRANPFAITITLEVATMLSRVSRVGEGSTFAVQSNAKIAGTMASPTTIQTPTSEELQLHLLPLRFQLPWAPHRVRP